MTIFVKNMPSTVKIQDLAEYVIRHCELAQQSISNLKLQKVLYYLQAYHLVRFDHSFFEDVPEAWVNGPVYRPVYNKYRPYGYLDIPLGFEESKEKSYEKSLKALNLESDQEKYLQEALDYFSSKSAESLVIRTHKEDPWIDARQGLGPLDISDNSISHESMKKYYTKDKK